MNGIIMLFVYAAIMILATVTMTVSYTHLTLPTNRLV